MNFRTVFRKETLNESRNIRTYLLRVAYVALVFALLMVVFRGEIASLGQYVSEDQDDRMARLAESLYTFTAYTQLLLVVLLTPVLVTSSFQSEKRNGTLELLTISRLTNRDVVLGKVFGKYVQVLTLVMAGVPILTLIKVFGFVELQYVLCSFFSSTAAMLMAGAIAAYYGMTARNLVNAIASTYGMLFVYALLTLVARAVLVLPFHDGSAFGSAPADWLLYVVNPGFAQFKIMPAGGAGFTQTEFALLSVGQLVFAMLVAWYFLNKAELEFRWWRLGLYSAAAGGSHEAAQAARQQRLGATRKRSQAATKPAAATPSSDADGALELQERLQQRANKLVKLARASLYVALAIGAFHLLASTSGELDVHRAFFSISFLAMAAIGTVLAGASIAQEQEDRTLIVMLTTPLTTTEILLAKAKQVLRYFVRPYLVMVGLSVFFVGIGQLGPWGLIIVAIGFPIYFGLIVTMSFCISATMARAGRAISYAVSFLILLTLGTFMIGSLLLTAAGAGEGASESLLFAGELVRALNPVVLVVDGLDVGDPTIDGYQPARLAIPTLLLSLGTAFVLWVGLVAVLRLRYQRWVRKHI